MKTFLIAHKQHLPQRVDAVFLRSNQHPIVFQYVILPRQRLNSRHGGMKGFLVRGLEMNALDVIVTTPSINGKGREAKDTITHAERNIFITFDRLFTWLGSAGTKDSFAISWTDLHGPLTLDVHDKMTSALGLPPHQETIPIFDH